MSERGDLRLPGSALEAVTQEVGATFRPPFEKPIAVGANAILMSALWFLLPAYLKDDVFTLHGSLVFAVVLAAWMYADVPATNVVAPDASRFIAAIDDPAMLKRLLDAKTVVLWAMVTPVCFVVAVVSGARSHVWLATFYSAIWVAVVPLGVLGITAWIGIVMPYHPIRIRERLAHRTPRRTMVYRWILLITIPYLVVPFLAVALMAPSLAIWGSPPRAASARRFPTRTWRSGWRWRALSGCSARSAGVG